MTTLLPLIAVLPLVFLFGAIIGSFANVVIYRMHTGKSLNNRSHCLSCGKTVSWYDLVPVFSYVLLRGRCRVCGAYIPARYVFVEAITGALFIVVFLISTNFLFFFFSAALVTLLIIICVYDLMHFIIPDELVLGLIPIAVILLAIEGYGANIFDAGLSAAAGATISFIFFAGLWYVSGGRWIGFGDAKLSIPLSALCGVTGVFSFIVLSFWIGAAVSLALLGLQQILNGGQKHLPFLRRRLKIKSEVPFAPFLIVAFILVFFFEIDVLAFITYALTY